MNIGPPIQKARIGTVYDGDLECSLGTGRPGSGPGSAPIYGAADLSKRELRGRT